MRQPAPSAAVLARTTAAAPGRWAWLAVATAFALYWGSNVILWYPWSISETLGIAMMLTLSPVMWAAGIAWVLLRWPADLWVGAAVTAAVMLIVSIVSDLTFFGLVRGAVDELLRPTTYAGYGWVAALPFLVLAVARRRIARRKRPASIRDILLAVGLGLAALSTIVAIITFEFTTTIAVLGEALARP